MKLEAALSQPHAGTDPRAAPVVSFFEFWPGWAFYAPIAVHWIALGLRYGSFTLPTAANPNITLGGLCGESKRSILDQVGPDQRGLLARYAGIETHGHDPRVDVAAAEAAVAASGFDYPFVAKPDIGCNGTGVRLVADSADLFRYVAAFPRNEGVLLQEFLPQDGEAGLFYVREPGEQSGRITSITLKYPPSVIGDGRSTLRELILADPRAGRVPQLYLPRLTGRLHEVPANGERLRLVFVGNHCKGSIFRNGSDLATPTLTARIDALAQAMPEFHFGRIDVRFDTTQALARGEGFRIIEINGAGSEATHVWDPATKLLDAWRAQFFHYGAAFRIGAANRARGFRPARITAMWQDWRRQKRLMAAYPMND
ncbi:MAG TPA: D-alanine--D-alanine ligase [Acetobacteraceae bacterium]|jgi:hypothetical protein